MPEISPYACLDGDYVGADSLRRAKYRHDDRCPNLVIGIEAVLTSIHSGPKANVEVDKHACRKAGIFNVGHAKFCDCTGFPTPILAFALRRPPIVLES